MASSGSLNIQDLADQQNDRTTREQRLQAAQDEEEDQARQRELSLLRRSFGNAGGGLGGSGTSNGTSLLG